VICFLMWFVPSFIAIVGCVWAGTVRFDDEKRQP